MKKIFVTVWNEYIHEVSYAPVAEIYPEGIHGCIGAFLTKAGMDVQTATLEMPSHGLTEELLAKTDVLVWWGHMAHDKVEDEVVEMVHRHVTLHGMGLIVLHSGHASKIFRRICGTDSSLLKWREDARREILWVVNPGHPIVQGLPEKIEIPHEEMYGEHFNIPQPDEQVFISWFEGGEVFRSGCCFTRGKGRIFYFRPGHETFPVYHMPLIQQVITNAARWAARVAPVEVVYGNTEPVVPLQEDAGYTVIEGLHDAK